MIIKAKYPRVGNKYVGFQGFGSLNGGNQISNVTKIDRLETLVTVNDSIFPIGDGPISEIISIERTDTLVAVHDSVFPMNPVEVIVMRLEDRSTYYENEVATLKILNDLVDL
mgnify:CR=1 FL=1